MRKNHLLQIRISADEKELARKLAESNGYGSISEFARSRIFESQLVIRRLNEIAAMLHSDGSRSIDTGPHTAKIATDADTARNSRQIRP